MQTVATVVVCFIVSTFLDAATVQMSSRRIETKGIATLQITSSKMDTISVFIYVKHFVASVCRIRVAEISSPFQPCRDGVRLALAKIHIEWVCGLQRRRCDTVVRITNISCRVSYTNVCAIRRCSRTVAERCVRNADRTVFRTGLGVIYHNRFVKVTSRCWLVRWTV